MLKSQQGLLLRGFLVIKRDPQRFWYAAGKYTSMIISASYKTDIPAFYGEWFMNRLRAGSCKMVNPYGGQIYTISLVREDVDGFVFWTKNIGPLLKHLPEIHEGGYPFIVQHT